MNIKYLFKPYQPPPTPDRPVPKTQYESLLELFEVSDDASLKHKLEQISVCSILIYKIAKARSDEYKKLLGITCDAYQYDRHRIHKTSDDVIFLEVDGIKYFLRYESVCFPWHGWEDILYFIGPPEDTIVSGSAQILSEETHKKIVKALS